MDKDWRKYFNKDEFEWFMRLGRQLQDPEEKRSFFNTVVEKKKNTPSYSIFEDFPIEEKAKNIPQPLPPVEERKAIAAKYSHAILEMLRGRKPGGENVPSEIQEQENPDAGPLV